ncbi:hypothetical protein ACJJTC_008796 [Scirpophaga incertulas]
MIVKCFLFTILFGSILTQDEFTFPANITLPPELMGHIDGNQLSEIQNKSLPALKKKCEENGGPAAYDSAQKAFEEFTNCLKVLVDPMALQMEIEEAKPNGKIDEVFKKYCEKTPSFKKCFKDMTEAVKPCFSEKERANLKTVHNITEQLAEFICFKEGDRIALFIAEGGQECFMEKQEQLQECANKTLGSDYQMDPTKLTPDSLPNISFGEKECRQMNELQTCVVATLEKCPTPTTSNIVESLFKFIRKATPCSDVGVKAKAKGKSMPDSASGLAVTSATVLLAIATLVL